MTRLLPALLLTLCCCGAAFAGGPDAARLAAARALEGRLGASVRWDAETGTPARVSLARAPEISGSALEAAASLLAEDLAPLFEVGLRASLDPELRAAGSTLVLLRARDLGLGRVRVSFAQRLGELSVVDAGLSVELSRGELGWRALRVDGRYYPNLGAELAAEVSTDLGFELTERFPPYREGELEVPARLELVIYAGGPTPRPAYRVDSVSRESHHAERIYLDARSGAELARHATTCEAEASGLAYAQDPGATPRAKVPLAGLYVYQGNARVTTDAAGQHPLSGTVTLDDALAGPLLRVFAHQEDELSYAGPADFSLAPREGEVAQDELAAWHHITSFNAHLRATYAPFRSDGALDTRFALLVRFKRNGQPLNNAFFTPQNVSIAGETFTGYLAMGTFSGRQAAKSGTVVQHEYCHALYSEIVALSGSLEAGGLNEGLADYFPAAFHEEERLGAWLVPPAGIRNLSRRYVWPRDNNGDVHRVGHIFAGALWRARNAAKARRAGDEAQIDQAVAAGVFRLQDRPSLLDAREAILEGDRAVNSGRNRVLLADAFNAHGIGPAAQNSAPRLAPIGDQSVRVGETLSLTLSVDDAEGDTLQVTLSPLANSDYDPAALEITFTPDASQEGPHLLSVTLSDGAETVSETIQITVAPRASLALPRSPGLAGTAASTSTTAAAATAAPGRGGSGGGGCSLVLAPAAGPWAGLLLLLSLGALRAAAPARRRQS